MLAKRETAVGHIVGLALTLAGAGMVACGILEKLGGGRQAVALVGPGLAAGIPGLALWKRTRAPQRIPAATIFAAVLSGWLVLAIVGAFPYFLSDLLQSFDLALFESVAGFTTTASTVITQLDGTSDGILLWRSMTQWFGGIGIIVFVVSVLPFLRTAGIDHGGMGGFGGSDAIAPRVRETSKRLVLLYVAFTAIVAGLYGAFGMSVFDAVSHSFTTVSTGGFSTHDKAFAAFDSSAIEWVAIGAMIFAGGNFAMYWRALRGRPFSVVRSIEFRIYLLLVALLGGAALLWNMHEGGMSHEYVRKTLFSSVSISTTTGFAGTDYNSWAGPVQLLILFAMAVGGMAGSTAGGFKVFRMIAIVGHARRHLFRQLHPNAVNVVRLGKEVISESVVMQVLGFFGLFMGVGAAATFLISALGDIDLRSSIAATASALGNVGPGLGSVGIADHYEGLRASVRYVLMVTMLAGRLELYPVLLGLVPALRFVGDRLPLQITKRIIRIGRG